MHKVGNRIFVSHSEIVEIRKEGKTFADFWKLSADWRRAMATRESAKFADMDKAAIVSCVESGLIRAIRYLDPIRFPALNAGSIFTWAFRFYTKEAYSERPVMLSKDEREADPEGAALLAAKTLEYTSEAGDTVEHDIPVSDEGMEKMESANTMDYIISQFEGRDREIVSGIAAGKTLVEIGIELDISRQYISKHFNDRIKPRLAKAMSR